MEEDELEDLIDSIMNNLKIAKILIERGLDEKETMIYTTLEDAAEKMQRIAFEYCRK